MTPRIADSLTSIAFSLFENRGVFALLLGSGLSRAAHIMTGWDITIDLVRRVAKAQGVEAQADWAAWYRHKTGEEPHYSKVIELLGASPAERRSILQGYIEPSNEDLQHGRRMPTAAHRAIARLVAAGYIRVIITTNFDRLLELALVDLGIQPTVVSSVDSLRGAEPFVHSKCYILKLHGDYKDARISNTEEELSSYPAEYETLLDRILDEHGLIVCGWSGEWDLALRAAVLRCPNRRYSTIWASHGTPGSGGQQIIEHRKAHVVPILGADPFFEGIEQRVSTLAATRQENPRTVELQVQTAKRYLAKPEHRIQLEDLLEQETARLVSLLDGPDFRPLMQVDALSVGAYLERCEAGSEILACLCGVIGKWGTAEQHQLVTQVLRVLNKQALKIQDGLRHYLSLRFYPAVLVFTAYGLGLTQARHWQGLRTGLTLPLPDSEGQTTVAYKLVREFGGSEALEVMPVYSQQIAPVSKRLYATVVAAWGKRFLALTDDAEMLFCRYEGLAAITCLECYEPALIEEEKQTGRVARGTWVPTGKASDSLRLASILDAELRRAELKSALLGAGFAKGDDRVYDIFADSLLSRMQRARFR